MKECRNVSALVKSLSRQMMSENYKGRIYYRRDLNMSRIALEAMN